MKIIFIRHTSVDVPPGTCYGQTDVLLKATFTEEAEKVKKQLERIKFDKSTVFSSPLSRCSMLAEYCGFSKAIKDIRLLEMNFGDWEMQRYDSIKDPKILEWYDNWLETPATNGESFNDQIKRVKEFISELQASRIETALVFTHGGVITIAKYLAGIADFNNMFSSQPAFGEITQIEF